LKVPALRLLGAIAREDVTPLVAEIDPSHPAVRFAEFKAGAAQKKDWTLLRSVIASAPGWSTPWMWLEADADDKDAPSELEEIAAAGWAALLHPADPRPAERLANALIGADRPDEALRSSHRSLALHDDDANVHMYLLDHYVHAERLGAWLE
jgi:hypothetical protein